MIYFCVIASASVLVLVVVYFAVRRCRRAKGERGYNIVGSGDGIGSNLLHSSDEEDDE